MGEGVLTGFLTIESTRSRNDTENIKGFSAKVANTIFLVSAMNSISKEELTDFIRIHKSEFFEKYGVHRIGFFGSVARGEHTTTSDIDIAIEMLPEKKNLHNFLELRRFLEKSLGAPVDLGIESTLKPAVKDLIKNEIIYV